MSSDDKTLSSYLSVSKTEIELCLDKEYDNDDDNQRTDPGARRHGNFINYYKFHSVKERLFQLPQDTSIWQWRHDYHVDKLSDRKYVGIDVGCNAGDLTLALHDFLKEKINGSEISLLGVDLDPILIERAEESLNSLSKSVNVDYKCADIMSEDIGDVINEYLAKNNADIFDVAFCFSITMWIHLNHGDIGLKKFLNRICERAGIVVVEPQPWKCYRNACRRMRRSNFNDIPKIDDLKLKGKMDKHIDDIILGNDYGFEKITESVNNDWGRKLLIYKKK